MAKSREMICTTCGTVGKPKVYMKGSLTTEAALWLFFGFGIFYSLWRRSTRRTGCPGCENGDMIPLDSPKGQKLLREQND